MAQAQALEGKVYHHEHFRCLRALAPGSLILTGPEAYAVADQPVRFSSEALRDAVVAVNDRRDVIGVVFQQDPDADEGLLVLRLVQ